VWWQVQSRHKRSVALDLKDPAARDIVRQLIAEADVLVENFKPGVMEDWGLGCEALSAANPGLIMPRISGYGQTGPYKDRPGFGVVAEAMGGLRHLTAEPGRVPVRVGVSIGDALASLHGVIGILMALQHRHASVSASAPKGLGRVIDVALYEAVFNCMESLLPEYSAFGAVREAAGSALPGIASTNAYLCADGWVLVAGNGDSIFKRLMKAMARDDLGRDARRAARQQRRARRAGGRDRRRHRHMDRAAAGRRGARSAECGGGFGRPHPHRERHRRRPARSGARHDPAGHHGRRPERPGALHRAQAEPDAGRHPAARPGIG